VHARGPRRCDISKAIASSGSLLIELILQQDNSPTRCRGFLDAGRESLQHVSSWEEALDVMVARLRTASYKVATEFRFGRYSSRKKGRIEP
jgi:hypothetical protein